MLLVVLGVISGRSSDGSDDLIDSFARSLLFCVANVLAFW
jgi:hypothetical protein